jgi:hypothetical protein
MRTRPFIALLCLAVACLLYVGCDDLQNPLSDPRIAKPDDRLSGVWRYDWGKKQIYFHVGKAGDELPDGVMRVAFVLHDTEDGTVKSPMEALLFSTTIGTNTYLNLAPIEGKEQLKLLKEKGWKEIRAYVLLKYKLEGDTLLLWKLDSDAKYHAIKDRKIKGVVNEKEGFVGIDTNKITDTTDNVARFVAKAGDSLFPNEAMRMKRME